MLSKNTIIISVISVVNYWKKIGKYFSKCLQFKTQTFNFWYKKLYFIAVARFLSIDIRYAANCVKLIKLIK